MRGEIRMRIDSLGQAARRACPWVCLVICLAMILGGCQKKEIPLSKAAEACKQALLGEMNMLKAAMSGPVSKQDWGAVEPILQSSFEKLKQEGKFIPFRIGVLDQNAITKGMFPPRKGEALDFSNYQPGRTVYEQKRITQAMLYLEGKKIFVLIAPLLQQDRVTGAVVMAFPEEELQKWHVPEKEFLGIDFNK
jgi:hypothetical protein